MSDGTAGAIMISEPTGHPSTVVAHIRRLQRGITADGLTVQELVHRLGPASVGLTLLTLAALALVPGLAPVFGAGLAVVSLGLVAGRGELWLPSWLRRRRIDRAQLDAALTRLAPRLAWLERLAARRHEHLLGPRTLRAAGLAAVLGGLLILLPIPFGNTAPALAVLVLALGLTVGDGLAVMAGLIVSLFALAIDAGLVFFGFRATAGLLNLFW